MTAKKRPTVQPGQVWRHGGDERHDVIREVRIDRTDPGWIYGTGVQSGRSTRIRRDRRTGSMPSPWRLVQVAPGDPESISAADVMREMGGGSL